MNFKNIVSTIYVLISVLIVPQDSEVCRGCVILDEYNFNKIINSFEVVLVKFEDFFAFGDNYEALDAVFEKLASELDSNQNILLADVGVQQWGDKENEELAEKYGITKYDLPTVILFVKNRQSPVIFPKESKWTVDNFRNFIRDEADVYIALPGCLEKFDKFAAKFMEFGDKEKILEAAVEEADKLQDCDKYLAENYIKYMKNVVDVGNKFVSEEYARLLKVLKDRELSDNSTDVEHSLNVLKAFSLPHGKDEL